MLPQLPHPSVFLASCPWASQPVTIVINNRWRTPERLLLTICSDCYYLSLREDPNPKGQHQVTSEGEQCPGGVPGEKGL